MNPLRMVLSIVVLGLLWSIPADARQKHAVNDLAVSEESQACLECHKTVTPGIVEDWRTSRHAHTTPSEGLLKPVLERRISSASVPGSMSGVVVGCFECHSQNPSLHKDNFEHFGYRINVVVTPNDCKTCHSAEAEEYAESKKAHALGNLDSNAVYHALVESIDGMKVVDGSAVSGRPASANSRNTTCFACHGTSIDVRGLKNISTSLGDIEVPDLANWPNQGVGRVNPDGSRGACTPCHTRHSFSIEVARKPFTCAQCHLEPDVPAWDVYRESKHGNIVLSIDREQMWDSVPWTVGKDFRAPTCATCHNSLIVSPEGEQIARRSHDFGSRLWLRIFGLIYSHPQPRSGNTSLIRNADNLSLPTTFTGQPAVGYLIDSVEQARRQEEMRSVCRSCHGTSWSNAHFERLAHASVEADSMVLAATKLLLVAWDGGLATKANPFDEAFEQKWIKQWLFYANSVRYASAMGGPDYASFEYGWWDLTRNLEEMRDHLQRYGMIKH